MVLGREWPQFWLVATGQGILLPNKTRRQHLIDFINSTKDWLKMNWIHSRWFSKQPNSNFKLKQNSKQSCVTYLLTRWNISGARGHASPLPVTMLVLSLHFHSLCQPTDLTTQILLIASLNLSPYPHCRMLCLCLHLLKCHLWSIQLLCLYFYWLQLFLFLFSMAQISVIFGKQMFFSVWTILLIEQKSICYERPHALG